MHDYQSHTHTSSYTRPHTPSHTSSPALSTPLSNNASQDDDEDLTAAQRALRGKPLDAAELEYQRRVAKEEELQRELSRRSTGVKRGLPRPAFVSDAAAKALAQPCVDRQNCTPEQILASEMVGKEMVRLVRNDEHKYPLDDPVAKAKAASGRRRAGAWPPSDLDLIDEQELEAARELIEHETDSMLASGVGLDEGKSSDRDIGTVHTR